MKTKKFTCETCGKTLETHFVKAFSGPIGQTQEHIHCRPCWYGWTAPTRPLRTGENPIGLHVVTATGSLREVYGCYKRPTGLTLCVRSFNREVDEEVKAEDVMVLDREWNKEACDPENLLSEDTDSPTGEEKETTP